MIHPRTPRCSTDESLGGCWFKGCLAEFTGTQGDGGLAEKPQGWRELRVCFCCFFKAAESRSRRKLSWSLGSWRCQGHPAAAAAHILPKPSLAQPTRCPHNCPDLPEHLWGGTEQGQAPRMWFYPARGEGLGQAREAEQISSARHLLPAWAEAPAAQRLRAEPFPL